jgi:hypothetical protein
MKTQPVICNPTRPAAGPDSAFITTSEFSKRVGANTGNMAFLYALTLEIENLKHVSERPLAEADAKVWGCSNFLARNRAIVASQSPLYTDGKTMTAIGLGAQAPDLDHDLELPEESVEWVRQIAGMAATDEPNISVRGTYTLGVLKKYGLDRHAVVLGCPSLFINPSAELGAAIEQRVEAPVRFFGAAPGNIAHLGKRTKAIESRLLNWVREYEGSYLLQHPPVLFEIMRDGIPAEEESLAEFEAIRANLLPEMNTEQAVHWFRTRGRLFDNIPSWLTHLASLDFVVGTRIHGVQLAIQAGTPAICLALDSRQLELCQVMNIPHVDAKATSSLDFDTLRQIVRHHDWGAFDRNRRQLATDYARFLAANQLSPSRQLLKLGTG